MIAPRRLPGLALALLAATAACARPGERPLLEPLPQPPLGAGAASPRVSGTVGSPGATPPAQVSEGRPAVVSLVPGRAAEGGTGDISLDFADTDIREVAAQILGNILRVNYAIDPAVRGTATLRTPRPLTPAQALSALSALLAQNGASLVQSGSLYRVVPTAAAAGVPGAAAGEAGTGGTSVVPLRYASAEDLARLLQPFVANGGRILADAGRNVLLVSGDPEVRETLLGLVRAFDVDLLAGQSYALFPVSAGDARDFAQALQEAFRGQGGGALAGVVRVVPMQRINAVLVISGQPRYVEDARRVYALVERARRATVRSWHVFYLQNSRSNDTAYVLQQAFTPRSVTAQPTPPGTLAPGRAQQQFISPGTGGGIGTGISGPTVGGALAGGGGLAGGGFAAGAPTAGVGGLGMGQASGAASAGPASAGPGGLAAPPSATSPANPLFGGLDPGGAEAAPEGMRIIPSPQNNALLVYGTPQERDTVERTLRRLDILPLQVRIDATIAEVTLNDQLQYGTQFYFKSGSIAGLLTTAVGGPVPSLATNLSGFVLRGRGEDAAPIAISALQAVTSVRVLSSPQLLVMDNEPARLQVGQLVPFLTQSAQGTLAPGAPIVSSVAYRDTGVIMEVTPRVNSGGLVTLDIAQEVSDVVPGQTTTPGLNSPTFSQRMVRTRVAVQDGQTIGLAGLIRDSVSRDNQGIPWLSNVPLLGLLAGSQDNFRQRTELLVLLTPRVIQDQRDARALTEDLRDTLLNAAAVPQQLEGIPLSGSPDPQRGLRRRLGLER